MTKRFLTILRRSAVLAVLCAALPASAASADLVSLDACDDARLSHAFAPWADPALYKLAPGGDLEDGVAGWTLSGGARVVADSEPYAVTGEQGEAALEIPAGASVTTPATCVNAAYPTIRFFSRLSGLSSLGVPSLQVELVYRDSALGLVAIPVGTALPSLGWQPTVQMLTGSAAAAALSGGEADLAIRFTSVGGTWRIDDVFVDPYRRA